MISALAKGIEIRNPFAYMFVVVLLFPPVVFIVLSVIEWIKDKRNK